MRPEVRVGRWLALLSLAVLLMACSRVTLLRPDTSRGSYRQVAHEVEIRPDAERRSGAAALARAAEARLLEGDAAAALASAQRAVRTDPGVAAGHSLVGLSLDALGRTREAGAHHRRAAELAPTHGALLNNYGTWLCSQGREGESLAWFERAWSSPGYSTPDAALANAGACALRIGQVERAGQWSREAIAAAPANPVALRTLAEVAFRSGRALEARAFVERRLAAAPADAETLLLASQIEKELGDTAASTRYVHRLRAEFPRTPESASEGGKR